MSATPHTPLLFLGDQRRQAVTNRVAEGLRRWRQSWVRDAADTFEVTAESPAAEGWTGAVAGVVTSVWVLEAGAERLAALLLPHATFAWAVQEAGTSSLDSGGAPEDSIAARLEQEVALTLLSELCQLERRDAAAVRRMTSDELAEWSRATRAWTFHARGAAGGRGCSVLLASSRVERLAPARAPMSGAPLDSRREAVGENTVVLRAVVGETALSMSELAEIALDDVLMLDQRLAEPVTLVSSPSGSPVATGSLGRSGLRRAIKVAGIPAARN